MAQRTIVQLTDDIDGSEATESLSFALDGVAYTIDLNDNNAAELREALAPYVAAARRGAGRGRCRPWSAQWQFHAHQQRAARPGQHRLRPEDGASLGRGTRHRDQRSRT